MHTEERETVYTDFKKIRCLLCGATCTVPGDLIGCLKICGKCEALPENERRRIAYSKPSLNRHITELY